MVRIAVVGTGYWGPNMVRIFDSYPQCDLRVICDSNPKKLERMRQWYPHLKMTQDVDEVSEDPEVQAVALATTSDTHFSLGMKMLEAGKHLLVEKPLAMNSAAGRKMVERASEKKLVLMVGHLLRYHNGVRKLKEYIDEGVLGEVLYTYSTRVNLGQVRKEENALWSFSPHDISVATYLLGMQPVAVSAVGQSYLQPGIHDVVFLNLRFPNSVMSQIHVSWLDPHKIRKLTVVGREKMAVFDDTEAMEKLRVFDKGVDYVPSYTDYAGSLAVRIGDILIPKIQMMEPLSVECQHFLECIEEGTSPLTDGIEGLRVLAVLEAAQKSLEAGGMSVPVEKMEGFARQV